MDNHDITLEWVAKAEEDAIVTEEMYQLLTALYTMLFATTHNNVSRSILKLF
ncbi:MAG: hypothetical protein GX811_04680 [Lentisphaerae bacterium]|nr:hypothetical protein [Lentisphaerota bacterium]